MGFGLANYVSIGIYLVIVALFGAFFSRRQHNTQDYFLGGRTLHWLPVAVSLFASLFSAVSFMLLTVSACLLPQAPSRDCSSNHLSHAGAVCR